MPTYEYVCETCGSFDHQQSMNSPKLARCPECGGKVVRKLGTGAGVIFKGSGFYETDYRSESYKKGEKAAKEEGKSGSEKKGKQASSPGKKEKAAKPAASKKD